MRPLAPLRLVVLLVAGCVIARAQATSAASAKGSAQPAASAAKAAAASAAPAVRAEPSVSVTFKTFALSAAVQGAYYKSGNMTVGLSAQPNTTSANNYNYSGSATMEIYRAQARPTTPAPEAADATDSGAPAADAAAVTDSASGRGGRGAARGGRAGRGGRGAAAPSGPLSVVGSVTFPKSGNFLVYLATEGNGPISGVALPTDTRDFPAGAYRIINGTGYALSLRTTESGTPKPLKVNDYMVYTPKASETFDIILNRADSDDVVPIAALQGLSAPPTGVRVSAFVMLTNRQQVLDDGAKPSFEIRLQNESGTAPRAPEASGTSASGSASGSARGGRRGGGTGRGGNGGTGRGNGGGG